MSHDHGLYASLSVTKTRTGKRFTAWFRTGYGHDRVSAVTPREVTAWRDHLAAEGDTGRDGITTAMAPATVNNHLAHLSALFSWIAVHAPAGQRHAEAAPTHRGVLARTLPLAMLATANKANNQPR
jgi:hypothetical protein